MAADLPTLPPQLEPVRPALDVLAELIANDVLRALDQNPPVPASSVPEEKVACGFFQRQPREGESMKDGSNTS